LRELIAEHIPPGFLGAFSANPEDLALTQSFCKLLAEEGLLCLTWPQEYGGGGGSVWEQTTVREEMWAHHEPRGAQYMGVNWVGPALMRHGTAEQRAKHLPPISAGEVIWCQGFSEPEAGSDLASLRTRAERHPEGGYVINGRKIWTSYAHSADWIFLLTRMDEAGQKTGRAGVTVFLLPMNLPGMTFKTIRGIHSAHDFHESVFDNVRATEAMRLGEEGRGWDIVRAVLNYERVGQAHYENAARGLARAVELLQERGEFDDAIVQAAAASVHAAIEAARVLTYKVIDQRARNQPPTEFTSIARFAMIRANQAVFNFICTYVPDVLAEGDSGDGRLQNVAKVTVSSGIAAGAAEVQLNLISAGIGLPKG